MKIEVGLCQCGCGGKTKISPSNQTKRGYEKGKPRKFIAGHKRGIFNHCWKGGKRINRFGYVVVWEPSHPRSHGGYVLEHILVLEKALGRPVLLTESSHHIDGNRANNEIGNLMLFASGGQHRAFHTRLNAFKESGHWDWRKCSYCKEHDAPDNLYIRGQDAVFHLRCAAENERMKTHGTLDGWNYKPMRPRAQKRVSRA